ncbi:MAG: secretin N-terminal domain-containing protein [Candidatus Omnitrophota bacterium]
MKKTIPLFSSSVLAVFSLCLCLAQPVMAEEAAVSLETVGSPELVSTDPGQPALAGAAPEVPVVPKVERTEDGKYYLDFKSAALLNVLSVLSNLSGINFIAGTEVSDRKVSMTLDNVALEDVLQAISYGCNVSYEFLPGRNIYLFRASSDAAEMPSLMTRVFKLYYMKVSNLKEIENSAASGSGGLTTLKGSKEGDIGSPAIVQSIEKILSSRGKVSVDDRSNSLIVTDSEDRLKMIESAIAQLDRPLDQVLINVILVETFEDLDRNLGIQWGGTDGTFGTISGGSQKTEFPFRTNAPTDAGFFGDVGNTFKDTANQFNPTIQSGIITPGVRNLSAFQVTVKAMEDADKLKILAKPKILALDNQAALIKISTQAAIGNTTTSTAGTTDTTGNTERYEIGTILRVTPLINTGGRITLTVEPTFATVAESAIAVYGSSAGAPKTGDPTTRTARTTLMVNDGQTIALGGLLFSEQRNDDRKVPFFGNIPVIGKALFTSNTKSIKDRELILFVTPYIVTDPSMLQAMDAPERRLDFEEESAPFWKVKDKQWYKDLKDGEVKKVDFDGYFNLRKKLIDSTLSNLEQSTQATASGQA